MTWTRRDLLERCLALGGGSVVSILSPSALLCLLLTSADKEPLKLWTVR